MFPFHHLLVTYSVWVISLSQFTCCFYRAWYLPSDTYLLLCLQVSEKSLVVTEGENPVFLTISATLPPRILCRSPGASCSWQITTTFMTSTTDLRCADGRNIAQALLRWVDKNDTQESFCGATLTDANWLTGTRLAVLASTDTLKDRTQTRSLLVQAKLFVSGAFQRQVQIDTVQVRVVLVNSKNCPNK